MRFKSVGLLKNLSSLIPRVYLITMLRKIEGNSSIRNILVMGRLKPFEPVGVTRYGNYPFHREVNTV